MFGRGDEAVFPSAPDNEDVRGEAVGVKSRDAKYKERLRTPGSACYISQVLLELGHPI